MAYKDVLSRVIKDSKLSLREIASRCETIGVSISPSYLSQIQTGKLPPPSEEVSKAIAQVCSLKDSSELIFEGYMEKAPELIKYYLSTTSETNKQLLKIIMPIFHPNINQDYIDKMDTFTRLGTTVSYLEKLKRQNTFEPFINMYKVLKQKYLLDNTFDEMEQVFMSDNSMEPLIPKNSKLKCIFYRGNEPSDKDIIAFSLKSDKKITARRYYSHNNIITLIPENRDSEIMYLKSLNEISLYGKVISYTASINY